MKYNVNPDSCGKGSKGKLQVTKGDSKGKGFSKGKSKSKGKSADRAPDFTTYGHPRDDNHDSSGPSRKWQDSNSWTSSSKSWQATPSRSAQGQWKGKGSWQSRDVFICLLCVCALRWNADCPQCLQRPLPSSFTTRGTARVETLWCPGPTDSGICGHPLGISDCPLCAAHKQFCQYQRNLNQKLVYPPAHFCKFLQLDRFLYSLDLAVEPTFQYQLQEVHQVLDGQTDSYTFEQWACHWIALATSPTDIQGFLPLPKASKLPDLLRSEPSLHNCGFTLIDNWLRENLLWLTFLQVQSQTGGITIKPISFPHGT